MASSPSRVTAETTRSDGRTGGRADGATRSAFVYTVTTGARAGRSKPATTWKSGAGYSGRGWRYTITSASAIARSAAARIASCSGYSGSSRPGESVKMNCASVVVSRPTTGSRVDCGLGDTIARCSPTRAFNSVDLPTLGRPARATVPQRVMQETNAACGMRNAEFQGEVRVGNDLPFSFRIPHSAFGTFEHKNPPGRTQAGFEEKLAAAYSPTTSQSQYH